MNFLKALLFPGSRRVSCPLSTLNGEIPVPGFEPELLWIQKGVLPLSYSYSHPLINCCNIGLNLFAKIYAFLLMLCFLLSGVQGSAESSFIQNCTSFNTIYVPTLYFHTVQFRIIFFYCLNGLENKKCFLKDRQKKIACVKLWAVWRQRWISGGALSHAYFVYYSCYSYLKIYSKNLHG